MRSIIIILLSMPLVMNSYFQKNTTDRQPVAAGRFYSANKETLSNDVGQLFNSCKKQLSYKGVRAIISPHAGYVFSGKTAAEAFSAIKEKSSYNNIFLIGSSHVMAFNGASVYSTGDFITPLGKVEINREITGKLKTENRLFNNPAEAHRQEHSLEVQLPFIQYYFTNNPKIVPIIIGSANTREIKNIAEILRPWFSPENLFIISSDFSHYPSYNEANEIDRITSESIISGDPQKFLQALKKNSERHSPGLATSMCGWTSGLLLMYLAEGNNQLEFKHIGYSNSGDSFYGNKEEVVGYQAIALVSKSDVINKSGDFHAEVSFTQEEAEQLISIARTSIRKKLFENKEMVIDPEKLPLSFTKNNGAFVTLKINGSLRGCIGRFISTEPLYEVVRATALSSAFEDSRFPPLSKEEFDKTEIEISVLGPLKKIDDINEIVLGRHGIYIKKGYRSGTMLPQVATENGWSLEEFLGYTSRDKAGLGWNGWKDSEILTYEAVVLEEK
jgi:AmmeMemoRadiSam system protein B/AmmeMemoRadiSam system protein A